MPKYLRSNKLSGRISWEKAEDVAKNINEMVAKLNDPAILGNRIFCYRSYCANTRAFARIWGLPRIWQIVLKQKPAYVIEVISEKYDKLSEKKKHFVLTHELAHIPGSFSGALTPHYRKGKKKFSNKINKLKKILQKLT